MNPALKEKALQWFASGQDYKSGLQILVEAGKTPMARIMANRAHRYAPKLALELRKLTGSQAPSPKTQDPSPKSQAPSPKPQVPSPKPQAKQPVVELVETPSSEPLKPSKFLPPASDSSEATKEHARLFRLRSQLAEQRQSIPQTNTPENNKKRRVLSQSIHELSEKIETLFQTKNQPTPHPVAEPANPPSLVPRPSSLVPRPSSLAQQISNLRKAIQKDQAMLLYQQQKKLDKPNPMPKGEKRTKLEKRITLRNKEIEKLKSQIPSPKP